jgi:hypothetical protein
MYELILSLSLIRHHGMKTNVAILKGNGHIHTQPLYSWERRPSTPWIGGCVDHRTSVDASEGREISWPYRESSLLGITARNPDTT